MGLQGAGKRWRSEIDLAQRFTSGPRVGEGVKEWGRGGGEPVTLTPICHGPWATLYIPADLAYGERGNRNIEPNSVLVFDVEVLKVGKFMPKN